MQKKQIKKEKRGYAQKIANEPEAKLRTKGEAAAVDSLVNLFFRLRKKA